MDWQALLPILILLSSLVTGIVIFGLPEERQRIRTALNLGGAVVKLALVVVVAWAVGEGYAIKTRIPFLPGLDLVLQVDSIALLFLLLSASLWLLTTVYAIGYLEGSPNRSRFFGFFSLCVTSTMGIALAGNLITFFVFYELLTVATYPLVVHRGTVAAVAAGKTYLLYTLTGGVLLLVGMVWLQLVAGPVEFTPGGALSAVAWTHPGELAVIFVVLIAGLGVKAALVPLHGWLPEAMVAPAPVSALLHAVAVVKAGAYGIVRVVHDLYGVDLASDLGVLLPLAVLASITIVYGSVRALGQEDLKRRLAYSTVSQVAYIALGAALVGPLATTAALVHLMHQGLMKVTLFFCAGNVAETLGVHSVRDMDGVGRRMPFTMGAFTIAAFGMMGVPPMAGFVSKWYLGLGGLEAGQGWVLLVLAASSLLNAAYFLPVIANAWFRPYRGPGDAHDGAAEGSGEKAPAPYHAAAAPHGHAGTAELGHRQAVRAPGREDAAEPSSHPASPAQGRREAPLALLVPALSTAALALAAGLFAGAPFSPLDLAAAAVREIYGRP
jgi:multicomponent Na+:H+ antiporter subunit D